MSPVLGHVYEVPRKTKDPMVYDYLDYRAFLRDLYESRKKQGRAFSYRGFSKRAGLKSPNYLKLVMDGDRNLTGAMSEKFARALDLDEEAQAFFMDLVQFNQAKSTKERNAHYEKLSNSRRYKEAQHIDIAHAAYHSSWFIPAVRELVARPDFRQDPAWIARILLPPIGKRQAEKALKTLFDLGMLRMGENGQVEQQEPLVSTGPETSGIHIANYHRTMMRRASDAIELCDPSERDISSLTLCLGEDGIRKLKRRLKRFRRELLELAALEDDPLQVLQVNFQLFPLSCAEDEESQEDKS